MEILSEGEAKAVKTSDRQRALLVFHLADQLAAIPLAEVESVMPMAHLERPPGIPSAVDGILNLGGSAVPVWRLDRLLQLPGKPTGLYSMLIVLKGAVLKGVADCRTAMLVDRVSEILSVPETALLPVAAISGMAASPGGDSFNGCAEAGVSVKGQVIHLLSLPHILLRQEREALSGLQAAAQRRLRNWETANPRDVNQ
jgi:purine-binding chemotaxis protein CheW